MPTETEIAWAAGLVEGEAWIGASGNSARLAIAMVDHDVVARFAAIFELREPRPVPPPKDRPNRQMQWGVYAYGREAMAIILILLPYFGHRRSAKVREVQALMGEKYDPRPCVECREMFVPHQRATLGQRFCSSRCNSRAKKRRRRVAYAAAMGREVGARCETPTAAGLCRNFPLVDKDRCRHHDQV
ncbi:MAG: hypothetical protein WKF96_01285 [Solirubrobacteraceae bacterium]